MSKGHHYCSILNYLKDNNEVLYNLIQDLCIGRMLNPRPHMGVTFLEPDNALTKQLKDMYDNNNELEAVKHLQASVVMQHLGSLGDFEDTALQTFLRQVLPVVSVKDKEVKLQNGAVVANSNFKAREDRNNIAVYKLSGALVPIDSAPAKSAPAAKPKAKKKGGAEYGKSRAELFAQVLKACDEAKDRDPALEVLVAMLIHFQGRPEYDLIASQLSNDTLTSLAIVLQPYRDEPTYIKDEEYDKLAAKYCSKHSVYAEFIVHPSPVAFYQKVMSEAANTHAAANKDVADKVRALHQSVAKPTIISEISKAHAELMVSLASLPAARKDTLKNAKLAMAEAELRVLGALLLDNNAGIADKKQLYESNCKLNKPYLCTQSDVKEMDIALYYSLPLLIVRSNAIVYLPHNNGEQYLSLADVARSNDSEQLIDLCKDVKLCSDEHYAKGFDKIVADLKAVGVNIQ